MFSVLMVGAAVNLTRDFYESLNVTTLGLYYEAGLAG